MRWNAIIDTGGTPPRLRDKARNPREIAAEITAIADENDCNVEIYFDRFSWFAYITLIGRSSDPHQANADARKALEVLEADEARQELDVDEKERHPNAGMGYDAAT
jgi:hypothetical protein